MEFDHFKDGRPIGIIAPGYSLAHLDVAIDSFKDLKICWGTLNYHPDAKNILDKIGKSVEFMIAFALPWSKHGHDMLAFTASEKRGGSIHEFLCQCIDHGIKNKVYIFGYDGYVAEDEPIYYKGRTRGNPYKMYVEDAQKINDEFPKERNGVQIFNCSSVTRITTFKKLTIEECLSQLNMEDKHD